MMGLLEQVGGGGVSIRYGQFENALLSAGHEVRVLSPDRANVDCIVLNDKLHGFPFFEWTFANVCRLAAAIRWADVVVMPEVSAASPASGVCGLSVLPQKGVIANVPYCRANRPRWRSCLPSCTRCSAMAGESGRRSIRHNWALHLRRRDRSSSISTRTPKRSSSSQPYRTIVPCACMESTCPLP